MPAILLFTAIGFLGGEIYAASQGYTVLDREFWQCSLEGAFTTTFLYFAAADTALIAGYGLQGAGMWAGSARLFNWGMRAGGLGTAMYAWAFRPLDFSRRQLLWRFADRGHLYSNFSTLPKSKQSYLLDHRYGGDAELFYESMVAEHRMGESKISPYVATDRNLLALLRSPDRVLINNVISQADTLYLLAVPPELTCPIPEIETEVLVKALSGSLEPYVELALPNPFRNQPLLNWVRGGG